MDDITAKLSELLNSPDAMEKIRAAAGSLLGTAQPAEQAPQSENLNFNALGGLLQGNNMENNAQMLGSMMRIIEVLGRMKNDPKIDLIMALKPYLSEKRAAKADKAASFLKVAAILPVIRREGLLENLI